MQTINKWLEAIGMGRYATHFIGQGFATPRQILLLTDKDLESLGVGVLEHRKKIMKAIQNTRDQVYEFYSLDSDHILGQACFALSRIIFIIHHHSIFILKFY